MFGDFLDLARSSLGSPAEQRTAAAGGGDIQQVSTCLLRVIVAMDRFVQDITTGPAAMPAPGSPPRRAWADAASQARDALANATAVLAAPAPQRRRARQGDSDLGRRLARTAVALAAGRDLLHTHIGTGTGGPREISSEWALTVTSPAAARAVLWELGALCRQIAPVTAQFALAPGSYGTPEARRDLTAACQWLWVLSAHIENAHRKAPLRAYDAEILRAIPASSPPQRRLPRPADPVAGLCEGVTSSAWRARDAARQARLRPPWSPGLTANALRQVAAASTVTSHNCQTLLQALAIRAGDGSEASARLERAAEAAGQARDGWVQVAHALDQVTTDTRGHLTPPAAEAADLALWTGRLAYADPGWTLASGPGHQPRTPQSLAPGHADLRRAVSAIHYACHTLATLARTEREQIRTAGTARRILVPTRSLPDTTDIPRPFAPAPPDRINALMADYEHAAGAAAEATAAVGDVAIEVRAPSRVLTLASPAADGGRSTRTRRAGPTGPVPAAGERRADRDRAEERQRGELPGPVERTLQNLGVTDNDLLRRGADLDHASERLIIEAASQAEPQRAHAAGPGASASAGSTELVNHVLAAGDPRAAALLQRRIARQAEPRQAEP